MRIASGPRRCCLSAAAAPRPGPGEASTAPGRPRQRLWAPCRTSKPPCREKKRRAPRGESRRPPRRLLLLVEAVLTPSLSLASPACGWCGPAPSSLAHHPHRHSHSHSLDPSTPSHPTLASSGFVCDSNFGQGIESDAPPPPPRSPAPTSIPSLHGEGSPFATGFSRRRPARRSDSPSEHFGCRQSLPGDSWPVAPHVPPWRPTAPASRRRPRPRRSKQSPMQRAPLPGPLPC